MPRLSAGLRSRLSWFLALAGATAVILAPAVWNGFPFMFYDTGAFIEMAVQGGFKPERSSFYALFLAAFRPRFSLWPAMVAQVTITALVIATFVRVLAPALSPVRFLGLVVALCLATQLPWSAAQVLPDILSPLMVLSFYLLGFHGDALGWPRKLFLMAVAIFGITSHASHLGLAAGLVVMIALLQIASRRVTVPAGSPRAGLPALVFGLSLLLLVFSNFMQTGDIFISRAGPSFLLGRLLEDGIVKRVLDDTCPQSAYRLCPFKDKLPHDSNDFLWGQESPFRGLGEFQGMQAEATSIIAESLRRYPWLNLKMAVANTLQQLITFQTGDGIEPLNEVPVPAIKRYLPGQIDGYRASRQQRGEIAFDWVNIVQIPIGALSIAALAAGLMAAIRRRDWTDRAFLPAFLLTALVGNAFICGTLSSPHDRYQSRLMGAATFAAFLLYSKGLQKVFAALRRPIAPAAIETPA